MMSDFAEIMSNPVPSDSPIVSPILTAGRMTLIRGNRFTGKTHFAFRLALLAATGKYQIEGCESAGGYNGIFLAGGMSKEANRGRLLAAGMKTGQRVPFSVLYCDGEPFNYTDNWDQSQLLEHFETKGGSDEPGFAIFDALPDMIGYRREPADWRVFMRFLSGLVERGIAVVLVANEEPPARAFITEYGPMFDHQVLISRPAGCIDGATMFEARFPGTGIEPFIAEVRDDGWQFLCNCS